MGTGWGGQGPRWSRAGLPTPPAQVSRAPGALPAAPGAWLGWKTPVSLVRAHRAASTPPGWAVGGRGWMRTDK